MPDPTKQHTWDDVNHAYRNEFMQPRCYHEHYREVETTDGTWVVPQQAIDIPDEVYAQTHHEEFADYVEGEIQEVGPRKLGYVCRLSAPGYMDATSWEVFDTEQEAIEHFMSEAPEEDTSCPICGGDMESAGNEHYICKDDECQRIFALAKHLEIDPTDIKAARYGKNIFEVNPRPAKRGTSPATAMKLVARLREALAIIIPESKDWKVGQMWVGADGTPYFYDTIVALLRKDERTAPMLKEGIHDVVNTLYFCSPRTDAYDHAKDHRDTIREAFNGLTPTDRRTEYAADDGEYLVLTDEEADDAWDRALDSLLDETGIVPGADSPYFDRERWKDDAKIEGRGHSLSSYDGCEEEVSVGPEDHCDETTYYIYRQH